MTEPLADRLLSQLLAGGGASPRVSLIGLSKNAGKTVALNHIIRSAAARGLTLGLVSTGRDGEEQDAVTELPKPRIWAPTGAYIATAQKALSVGSARVEVLQEFPLTTPFGPMVIGRVVEAGELLLIGPGSARRIAALLAALEARGAQLCLVDGSFDRIAAASPTVTGRVLLSAGAAYGSAMAQTVAQVQHVLALFDLPPVPMELEGPVAQAAAMAPVSLVTASGEVRALPVVSGLADPEPILAAIEQAIATATAASASSADGSLEGSSPVAVPLLVLTGAISDRLLQGLLQRRLYAVGLVLHDPTHVLVSRSLWQRWRSKGGKAFVRHPVSLLAVTTNPHSPVGADYDPQVFFAAVEAVADRPVFDLEAGLASV